MNAANEPVTVFRTFNAAEAQLIASRLNAANLHAEVVHEGASLWSDGYALAVGGVRVKVPANEAEEAAVLIAAKDPS